MFELSKEQLEEITKNAMEELKTGIRDDIRSQVVNNIKYNVEGHIHKYVEEFFREEIGPEIQAALIEQKPFIIQSCISAASGLAELIGSSLLKAATDNLSHSYKRKKIFGEIFD